MTARKRSGVLFGLIGGAPNPTDGAFKIATELEE